MTMLWGVRHANTKDKDKYKDKYTWARVSHALVDTRFERGLRLPKALRACEWFECRTHS